MRYIDLSVRIENGMPVYPGDDVVSLLQVKKLDKDHYNAYSLSSGMHSGTHLDCPMHLLDRSEWIGDFPLDLFAGRGCLIDERGRKRITYTKEYEKVLEGDIVLILTGTDREYGSGRYYADHPVLTPDLAQFLVSRKIKMLGVDMPSPDGPPFPIHKLLLGNGIFLLENLVGLEQLIGAGEFEFFAVPLNIQAEASLARAFARLD